ncbi:NAD-dependent epimerase/dehydratase family protein [Halocola ammonii]
MAEKCLVIGAAGQIGIELVLKLRKKYGNENVVAADIREPKSDSTLLDGPFEVLDVMNKDDFRKICEKHKIETVYQLAALLSATAEKKPQLGWELNMQGLFNVLDLAKDKVIKKIFWPSSIAVFGPSTSKDNTPQHAICEPSTVYGISKLAGERWCEYYFNKYGVDVRSLRYPGLIGHRSEPGGGTTDYAVEIFYKAVEEGKYECFLAEDMKLPMMYMEDAIKATIDITEAPSESVKIRGSYNLSSMSFSPAELTAEIKKHLPEFEISYAPDFRNDLAASWPNSINDARAREDWKWSHRYDVPELVHEMISAIRLKNSQTETL